mmetsp:Transcript_13365/g.43551  ORF Transcript_13365/g.43551 Transcript_13365/m.43551 type:complete len:480 (-) Transcript_13365:103-1542(-)|eukprot:CAMPEP_0118889014 /NCGR_PEP_ID=MMETSP1166-20130328/142_1 /TAXON_ID=1104430 /ORGANISM="Chrysoreinhardia sp, Strain CCMP3193" /LENGTH=479 /DNA_ID=CAMNT_0006827597 /DNA_START=179 /DNA_END=1618 /DNA_ORIENTATION=-
MEASYAYYPRGGFYEEHLDVPRGDAGFRALGRRGENFERREFSVLLYLNDAEWADDDGGKLRVTLAEDDRPTTEVTPRGGTLVAFRSDAIPHEVRESHRERWTLVAWFATQRPRSDQDKVRRFRSVVAAGERWERLGFDRAAVGLFDRLANASASSIGAVDSDETPLRRAYALVRKGHALYDGCDDKERAAEAFRSAVALDSESSVAWSGLGQATRNLTALSTARALSLSLSPAVEDPVVGALCLALLDDKEERAAAAAEGLPRYVVESLGWCASRGADPFGAGGTYANLRVAAEAAFAEGRRGAVLELGVFRGRSLRMLRRLCPGGTSFHAFDSFQGLPEAWTAAEPAGSYTTRGALPSEVPGVAFHVGWFRDTLPPFLDAHKTQTIALVHLDCDLYSSTRDALDNLGPRLRPGAVLVFDDFLAHPNWRDDQARAFQETADRFHWDFVVLAASLPTKQVVIQLVEAADVAELSEEAKR